MATVISGEETAQRISVLYHFSDLNLQDGTKF